MTKRSYVLSLPKGISLENDDTFSKDLLSQFDKRRSRLHFELGLLSEEPTSETPVIDKPLPSIDIRSEVGSLSIQQASEEDNDELNERPRSNTASDLLRRSSAFLRSKFDSFRTSGSKRSIHSSNSSHSPPTKIMMKTTISLQPPQQTVSAPFIPPTITQYPPKPLVYSPIEPIHDPPKQIFHRISMPLLKSHHQHSSEHPHRPTRRRSEPDNHNKFKKK
ncbi:hypothetical protein BY458DRAFT_508858 [Sporodiniella umbellata]|nr:hypothetical protein BY458DRAFT_508858 [Sporodiniella umbellata]